METALQEFGLYKDIANIVIDYAEAMDFEKQLIDAISEICDYYSWNLYSNLDTYHRHLRVYSRGYTSEIAELKKLVLLEKQEEYQKLENKKVKFWRQRKQLKKEIEELNYMPPPSAILNSGIYRNSGGFFSHVYANTTRFVKSAIPEEVITLATNRINKYLREHR